VPIIEHHIGIIVAQRRGERGSASAESVSFPTRPGRSTSWCMLPAVIENTRPTACLHPTLQGAVAGSLGTARLARTSNAVTRWHHLSVAGCGPA
jgi:hypothetical protein